MFYNKKVDLRIQNTRSWTFDALVKLLEQKDFNKINISEIIEKAGISRATFYRNFSTKDDIVKTRVKTMFTSFYAALISRYKLAGIQDEQFLVAAFFNTVDEEEKVIDTVIKCNLEYLMVDGILEIINYYKEQFYKRLKTDLVAEEYTIEIVASSAWTLLSRWHKTGKKESASTLSQIYFSAFRSVYIALFEDQSRL